MKYISVLIVLGFMAWTWSLATTPRDFSMSEHKRIEAEVEEIIREFIREKQPAVSSIVFQQLYTEVVKDHQEMVVHFRCQALESVSKKGAEGRDATASGGGHEVSVNEHSEDLVERLFEGYLRLLSTDHGNTWKRAGGEITSPAIHFLEGTRVTPDGKSEFSPPSSEPEPHPDKPQTDQSNGGR